MENQYLTSIPPEDEAHTLALPLPDAAATTTTEYRIVRTAITYRRAHYPAIVPSHIPSRFAAITNLEDTHTR